ncbi:DUF6083 domain-containing protein [Streptomyces sp. HC307]|uniref:DUF6083 domain-containing protein n=1 Tax=Streptomyces flavusporus TaxID=3385496 RepID=UPI0039170951
MSCGWGFMISGKRCDERGAVGTGRPRRNDPHLVVCDDCWPQGRCAVAAKLRCDACDDPRARWIASLGMALCTACEEAGSGHPSREPVLVGEVLATTAEALAYAAHSATAVPDASTSRSTTCDACAGEAEWYRTVRGRWVMIEPGDWPIGRIPVGRRWRVADDGTAVNLGPASPSDTCRISHFDVCPSRPAPSDSPVLLALWRRNAQRVIRS